MNKEEIVRMLESVPDSYDDFVKCTARWMLEDDEEYSEDVQKAAPALVAAG